MQAQMKTDIHCSGFLDVVCGLWHKVWVGDWHIKTNSLHTSLHYNKHQYLSVHNALDRLHYKKNQRSKVASNRSLGAKPPKEILDQTWPSAEIVHLLHSDLSLG